MRNRKTITISKLEYEQLQAEAALMWEMTSDYGKQRGDGTWEHPFWDVITRLHPYSAQRVIDADLAIQEVEERDVRRKFNMSRKPRQRR
jgi:hypothetical protein